MRTKSRYRVRRLLKVLAPEEHRRLQKLRIQDTGFGYDSFGLEPESVMLAYGLGQFFYKYWFRVDSEGVEHVPDAGPVILAPNHSGGPPIDGFMIAIDLFKKLRTPRVMRSVLYNSAGYIPFVNTFFDRCGQVTGARRNIEELLKQGELVAAFPEGARGPWKGFRDRYKVRPFNVGFVELSLRLRVPIVPTAVIGAEEQYPFMTNAKLLARALGLPFFPVTPFFPLLGPLGMLPLPTKYHIYYDEAFHFYREHPPETVHDPRKVRELAGRVQERVERLIQAGLASRKGVFGFLEGPAPRASMPPYSP